MKTSIAVRPTLSSIATDVVSPTVKSMVSSSAKGLSLLAIALISMSTAHSQTAGNWNLNGTLTGTPGSNISVSSFSLGSAIPSGTFNGGTEYYGEGGWPAGALDPNAYVQFTVTSASGYYLSLNSVTLVQRRSSTGSSGAGPNSWSLRSSLDNYTTDIATGSLTIAYVTSTVSLPTAFQSVPSTVTFRVYGYNMTISSGGTSRFVYDNVSVQGQAISGVLAQQSLELSAKATAPGNIALSAKTEGFETGANLALQRSTNGVDFTSIYQTQITASNGFQFQDATTASTLYYRLAVTLPDGTTHLSSITLIRQSVASQNRIKAVLAQGSSVRTILHIDAAGSYQLTIRSSDGRPMVKQTIQATEGDPVTELSLGSSPHGVYILTLSNDEEQTSRQFLY